MVQSSENRGFIAHPSAPSLALVWVISSQPGDARAVHASSAISNAGVIASSADALKEVSPGQQTGTQAEGTAAEPSGTDVLNDLFAANPELRSLVREAARELGRAFGTQAKIVIEPYLDPEAEGAEPRVFVVAVTSLPFEQADQILDSVLEGWWVDNQSRANYLVSLATELV